MDFEEWWKKEGQFLPPCDKLTHFTIEVYKDFARKVWEAREAELEEVYNTAFDEGRMSKE